MKPEFILMLTYNDQTVENALELFEANRDTPVTHWGFKDVGLPASQMEAAAQAMKAAGKTTFLEVVSLSEAEGLHGARQAVEMGFDILMGTVFYDSIQEYLQDKPVRYFPFPGHVHSHPSILDGSPDEIVAHARLLESKGVAGLDLLTYRFSGDAPELLRKVVQDTHVPVVSAGSIDSFQRMGEVREAGAWGFTIGTALFEKKFVPGGSFRDNILAVCDWLERAGEAGQAVTAAAGGAAAEAA
jgi:hypothetical protein